MDLAESLATSSYLVEQGMGQLNNESELRRVVRENWNYSILLPIQFLFSLTPPQNSANSLIPLCPYQAYFLLASLSVLSVINKSALEEAVLLIIFGSIKTAVRKMNKE